MADGNLVKNGNFSDKKPSIDPWWGGDSLKVVPLDGGSGGVSVIKEPLIVGQSGIELTTGLMYSLSFRASAVPPTRITVSIQPDEGPDTPCFSAEYNLTSTSNEFETKFSVLKSVQNGSLHFEVGDHVKVEITLGDVALCSQGPIGSGEPEKFFIARYPDKLEASFT